MWSVWDYLFVVFMMGAIAWVFVYTTAADKKEGKEERQRSKEETEWHDAEDEATEMISSKFLATAGKWR